MTDRTPEQRKADEALTKAVEGVALAYGQIDPSEMVMDYCLVGYANSMDLVEQGATHFFMLFRDNDVLTYTAEGLMREGLRGMLTENEGQSDV